MIDFEQEKPEYVHINDEVPPDVVVIASREQAKGAIPNGTEVEKTNSKTGDGHKDGDKAIVFGSAGPAQHPETGKPVYGYWVVWDDQPYKPCFIAGDRIKRIE